MRVIKLKEGLDTVVVIFNSPSIDTQDLWVNSCWRFRPGLTEGEKIPSDHIPTSVRRIINNVVNPDFLHNGDLD